MNLPTTIPAYNLPPLAVIMKAEQRRVSLKDQHFFETRPVRKKSRGVDSNGFFDIDCIIHDLPT